MNILIYCSMRHLASIRYYQRTLSPDPTLGFKSITFRVLKGVLNDGSRFVLNVIHSYLTLGAVQHVYGVLVVHLGLSRGP
jgi:hypothetical protein